MFKKIKDSAKQKSVATKMIITAIIIAFTAVNIILLGTYVNKGTTSYASDPINLSVQDNSTDNPNVKFSISFDSNGDVTDNTQSADISVKNLTLFAEVSVQGGGYLKTGKISFGDSNNFKLSNPSLNPNFNPETNLNVSNILSGKGSGPIAIPIAANTDGNTFNLALLDKQSTVTFTGIYSNNGQDYQVTATKGVHITWDASKIIGVNNPGYIDSNSIAYINNEVITNKVYPVNGVNKRIVQVLVNSGLKGNIYPIRETDITVNNPVLIDNTIVPEDVYVSTYGTNATNGLASMTDATAAPSNDPNTWTYDSAHKQTTIKLTNIPDSSDNVSWNKTGKDQIVVTYIYPISLSFVGLDGSDVIPFTSTVNSTVTLYDNSSTQLTASSTIKPNMTDDISAVTTFAVQPTASIYNSYLTLGQNVPYSTNWHINVSYPDVIADGISATDTSNVFSDGTNAVSVYKTLSINKNEFLNLLGDLGTIDIYRGAIADGDKITTVTKDTNTDTNGNLVFTYPDGVNNISIKTSSPVGSGNLDITNAKELTPAGLTTSQIPSITSMVYTAAASDGIESITPAEATILINNPATSAALDMNNKQFSTATPTPVIFTAMLHSDTDQYKLYNNPTFNIVLPKEVTDPNDVTNLSVNLSNGNGLTPGGYTVAKNSNGNVVITITLSGSETSYTAPNPYITVGATIAANPYIPTTDDTIILNGQNGDQTIPDSSVSVTFVTEQGMLPANIMGNKVSYRTDSQTGQIDGTVATVQTVPVAGKVLNNTGADSSNVLILGRIPFKGNTSITASKNLGTTVDTVIASAITASSEKGNDIGATVYYSASKTATNDVNLATNGWSATYSADAVSYLIVINSIANGDTVDFGYNIAMPASVGVNQAMYTTYAVYNGTEVTEAPLVGIETQKELDLTINVASTADDNKIVHVGERVIYSVQITNNTGVNVENASVTLPIPAGTTYTKYEKETDDASDQYGSYVYHEYPNTPAFTFTIPEIKVGETVNAAQYLSDPYMVTVNTLPTGQSTANITNTVSVTAPDAPNTATGKSTLTAKPASFDAYISCTNGNVAVGVQTMYTGVITNTTNKTMTNVVYTTVIPDGATYNDEDPIIQITRQDGTDDILSSDSDFTYSYDSSSKTLTYTIYSLDAGATVGIVTNVTVEALPNGETTGKVSFGGTVQADGVEQHRLNTASLNISAAQAVKIDITGSSNLTGNTVAELQNIDYTVSITNNGTEDLNDVSVVMELPNNVQFIRETPDSDDVGLSDDGTLVWSLESLPAGQTTQYKVTVYTNSLSDKSQSVPLKFTTTLSTDDISYTPHTDTYTLVGANANTDNNGGGSNAAGTYSISGTAWLDANKNGHRDSGEQLLSGITVKLMQNGQYVKGSNGNDITAATNSNGIYSFSSLANGTYVVEFAIDTAKYTVANNSGAAIVTINGVTTARTDSLTINGSNLSNIDIGLINQQIFDLSLNKYISKVTVQNADGTVVYQYDAASGKFSKVDVKAKSLPGTAVIVEYTIAVTNSGEVPGMAKSIVDYLSPDFKFSSELNAAWSEGQDGNLYSTALANTWINPGETKTIDLVLTKTMTANNTGTTVNTAEIYQDYNDYAIKDINSTPGNKNPNENDFSEADVLVTLRTGSPVMYISIIAGCMLVLRRRNILYK